MINLVHEFRDIAYRFTTDEDDIKDIIQELSFSFLTLSKKVPLEEALAETKKKAPSIFKRLHNAGIVNISSYAITTKFIENVANPIVSEDDDTDNLFSIYLHHELAEFLEIERKVYFLFVTDKEKPHIIAKTLGLSLKDVNRIVNKLSAKVSKISRIWPFFTETEREIAAGKIKKLPLEYMVTGQKKKGKSMRENELIDALGVIVKSHLESGNKNIYNAVIELAERVVMLQVLEYCNGNQIKAANILGISRNTLRNRIKEWKA
jgi:DNA-binding protein Fis